MKIGISTSTFFNNIATEGMFELLRNMRADTTQVCLNTFSEYEKSYVDSLVQYRGGVNVVSVSPLSTQFEPQLFSSNMKVRTDAETIFKKICYACLALGAKYYTFRGAIDFSSLKNIDPTRYAQRYNRLSDIANTYGVTLSVKNMRWNYAATPEFYRKMLDLCPNIAVSLDLYHAETVGYELREFMDVCPSHRISQIEVADFIKGEWCLPGKGKYNFERLFNDLDKRKIVAPVLISARSDSYSDFVQVRDSFEYLVSVYNESKN